jgi:xanthine dehydrogenase YagR molybdenum-binding subunit
MSETYIGKGVKRVDGPAKVKGEAKYAAEFFGENLAYGVVVTAGITKGRISSINTKRALAVEGVVEVFTHENRPHVSWFNRNYKDQDAPKGEHFRALYDNEIYFSGQPIALVVADTFEAARYAASFIEVLYNHHGHSTDLHAVLKEAYDPGKGKSGFEPPHSRGDANEAYKRSPVRIEAEYEHGAQHHNPMEMHASTVIYDDSDESFTIYDKTQSTQNSQAYVCSVFGLPKKKVRVQAPFVGGAFGSGLRPQYQLYLAVLAAKALKRSVRVVLTRQQMFTFGHRPHTIQKLSIGTDAKGILQAIKHEAVQETSTFEDYTEVIVNWSGQAYKCDNIELKYEVAQLDLYTPLDMRAPGATTGVFALECAIDEAAVAANVDPLQFRIQNYTETDPMHKDRPYSSKALKEAYRQGAEKFGWSKRKPEPGSMTEGRYKIGWGMATGIWDAMQQKAAAKAKINADGSLEVSSAITDIGTGTYTMGTQIAADTMGLSLEKVTFKLGDSDLPAAPLQGGSWTAASVGSAIQATCEKLKETMFKQAKGMKDSPLSDLKYEDVRFENGNIISKAQPSKKVSFVDVVKSSKKEALEEEGGTAPNPAKQEPYSRNTHSAVFVEVKVDEEMGTIGVSRVVSAIAAGKILNPKLARSQILGGVVWGISMALQEESFLDHTAGKFMNHNYAEYHIPVNRDIGEIDVIFVEEHDEIVSPMGVKGVGEIGIVAVASAVANAVFHATGKRIRKLPLTVDKLLM